MTDPEFFRRLICWYDRPKACPDWSFVGATAYLRTGHGVFKLAPWDGGVRDRIAGLQGTYTSQTGAQDHVVFEFHDLLKPSAKDLKNPDLASTHRIHAWHTGDGARRQVEWYVPPASLHPLGDAIVTWLTAWGGW